MAESNLQEGSEVELGAKRFYELLDQEPPDQLYHYTDQTGLLDILNTGELWATKVQYMNDATEFGLAVDLAKSRLEERIRKFSNGDRCELLRTIADGLSGIARVNVCFRIVLREPRPAESVAGVFGRRRGRDWVSLCRSKKSGLERRGPPWPLYLQERRPDRDH
jgi:hypothetical protein